MKNKWKWVYNPFEKIAGWQAFGIGILILAATTVVGFFGSHTLFFPFQVKFGGFHATWNMAFAVQALSLAVTVILMYVTALFFAKHVRFQDILGTVTLAKYPLLLMAFLMWLICKPLIYFAASIGMPGEPALHDYSQLLLIVGFGIIALIMMVWTIALLYNAFKVSANLKGVKCALLFTAILLVSDFLVYVPFLLFMNKNILR